MPLTPGTRLGVYEILSVLGAGGMGEVYRARDSRLGREVAIKVILDVFAVDPDRVARFEREAKVLASLNHPHIAALYGMEASGGRHFLVMELVEGQTLAERLVRGPLPREEMLAIAVQIAEALEAAHEKGIVHRDLKPANVKITPDDRVKVLDFGLAKAIESEAAAANVANSPTLSMMATQAGIILGTAAYMSPEQAKGLSADHRSDVFSFGSVLFEMLTGRQPFHGDTAPEVLASVLVREADMSRLPADVDPRLVELVRRCLEKQPRRRWQAIGDVRAELEAIAVAPRTAPLPVITARPSRPLWWRAMPVAIAAIGAAGLAAAAAWALKPSPPAPVVRFSIHLPADRHFSGLSRRTVAISPDGSLVAYVADRRLYLRPVRDLHGTPLQGADSPDGVFSPVFSPDGRSLAFYSVTEGALKRITVTGGPAVTLCAAGAPWGISWGSDGIVFGQVAGEARSIQRVADSGGTPQQLVTLKSNELPESPQILPDGDTVLYSVSPNTRVGGGRWDTAQVIAQSVKTGARKVVIDGGSDAQYLSTGHLAYAIGSSVFAAPFDLGSLTVTGEAFPILEGVRRAPAGITGIADFSVAAGGSLAFVPGPTLTSGGMAFALSDSKGVLSPLKLAPGSYGGARVSRDGKRVAFEATDGQTTFVGVYDVAGTAALRRITFGGNSGSPVWSPDGKRVAYQWAREGDFAIFSQAADGGGAPERLTKPGPGETHVPHSWSKDVLLFDVVTPKDVTLWQLSLKDRRITPFGDVRSSTETGATLSPDGRWVAYSTTEDRVTNVFVQPFPATGIKHVLVRTRASSAHHPIWTPDGGAVLYVPGPGVLERVSVATRPVFSFGNPENIARPFQGSPPGARRTYDMMPDGRILALVTPNQLSGGQGTEEIYVVLNWFEELKARRVPGR